MLPLSLMAASSLGSRVPESLDLGVKVEAGDQSNCELHSLSDPKITLAPCHRPTSITLGVALELQVSTMVTGYRAAARHLVGI